MTDSTICVWGWIQRRKDEIKEKYPTKGKLMINPPTPQHPFNFQIMATTWCNIALVLSILPSSGRALGSWPWAGNGLSSGWVWIDMARGYTADGIIFADIVWSIPWHGVNLGGWYWIRRNGPGHGITAHSHWDSNRNCRSLGYVRRAAIGCELKSSTMYSGW